MKSTAMLAVLVLILAPSALLGQDYYLGNVDTECSMCHGGLVTSYLTTGHATTFDDIPFLGYSCLGCHTTGWDEGVANYGADEYVTEGVDNSFTITDPTNFGRVKNVQCENCHGTVGTVDRNFVGFLEHQAATVVDLGADNCGACHQGSHHPTFTDWQASLHAISKLTSRNLPVIASSPTCAGCHTAEGFIQFAAQPGLEPDVIPPGPDGNDLTCAACHVAHGTANAANLRMSKTELCVKCHNPEYDPDNPVPEVGQALHHTTAFMFEGTGGYEFPGFSYPSSAHKLVVTDKCVTCHVHMIPFDAGPPEVPAFTGHTFEPHGESCVPCHTDYDPAGDFDYHGVQTEIVALMDELHTALAEASPQDSLTDAFLQADWNYQFVHADGSHGIHNTDYARALLEASIASFVPVAVTVQDFAALSTTDGVELSWKLGDWNGDLRTLRIQRAEQVEGPYRELNTNPVVSGDRMTFRDNDVVAARDYWYRLRILSADGAIMAGPIHVRTSGVELMTQLHAPYVPDDGGLVQIRYSLSASARMSRLEVFDVRGRRLRLLDSGRHDSGTYVRTWDRRDAGGVLASRGVYFVNLTVDNQTLSRKFILLAR